MLKNINNAPIAQLDRATDFGSVGCGFNSYWAHQSSSIMDFARQTSPLEGNIRFKIDEDSLGVTLRNIKTIIEGL